MKSLKKKLLATERYISKLEQLIIVSGLSLMIFFGALQVVLRNLFNTGINWGDLLVRALVLWIGFTGASLASRRGRHISIDAVSKFIKNEKLEKLRRRIVGVLSFFLSVLLLKASIEFTLVEARVNISAFLGISTWVVFIIVPISLFLISLRILISTFTAQSIEQDDAIISNSLGD